MGDRERNTENLIGGFGLTTPHIRIIVVIFRKKVHSDLTNSKYS